MKAIISFTEFNPLLEAQGDNAVYSVWTKTKDFIAEIQKNQLRIVERSIDAFVGVYPIIDKMDRYYKKNEGVLIIRIEVSPKLFSEGNFSAEIQIHAPNEFPFSKSRGENDNLPFWQPQELADELIELSHEFVFFGENKGENTETGYFKKIIVGGER